MRPDHDTIVAPATAAGGALAVLRISGDGALAVCDRLFRGRTALGDAAGYTVHYGRICDGERIVDDVLATVFRAPHSYTGEDSVELSCHGSAYIVSELLRLLTAAGARPAEPGEFTTRAYLAGKLDLSQAEAVADLIASSSRAAHALAATQMRGGYSAALESLREQLLELASLLELELDFGEEEVEFADRTRLRETMECIGTEIDALRGSFALGNAIREGVPVAIAGAPNVGKSTLLNRLLNEERAMVSDIAGTTRDVIEECINIDGVVFRFLDTAGIRSTDDRLERMGIERTLQSIARARIIIRLLDAATLAPETPKTASGTGTRPALSDPHDSVSQTAAGSHAIPTPACSSVLDTSPAMQPAGDSPRHASSADALFPQALFPEPEFTLLDDQRLLTVVNKTDRRPGLRLPSGSIGISAKTGAGIDALLHALRAAVDTEALYHGDTVVSNSRHFEALTEARQALDNALRGLRDGLPSDLLSEDIRQVILHLGTITGRGVIASDEILHNIFSKFCIGK